MGEVTEVKRTQRAGQVENAKWKVEGGAEGKGGGERAAHRHKGKVAKSKTKVVRFYCHINA